MRIDGLSPGKGTGTLVFVTSKIAWGLSSDDDVTAAIADLQKRGVIAAGAIKNRALNTKVLAFQWSRPKAAADAAAQKSALEAHKKHFAEARCFDVDICTDAMIDPEVAGVNHLVKTNWLDGIQLVVEVAKRAPERLREDFLVFLQNPQRPDWAFDDLFKAGEAHKDAKKRGAVFEAIASFPPPPRSNDKRATFVTSIHNALLAAESRGDKKRAKELADQGSTLPDYVKAYGATPPAPASKSATKAPKPKAKANAKPNAKAKAATKPKAKAKPKAKKR